MARNETRRSAVRAGVRIAAVCALATLAMASDAWAASRHEDASSLGHAACLFAIVWFIASCRIRRVDGRWTFGFQLSPLAPSRAPSSQATTMEGAQS